MAVTPITLKALARNVASGNLTWTTETSTTDGFTITLPDQGGERLLISIKETGSTTDTVTIKAGDNPPAVLAGLGDLAIAIASGDEQVVAIETARFKQNDGTIIVIAGKTTTHVGAIVMPNGGGGGAG